MPPSTAVVRSPAQSGGLEARASSLIAKSPVGELFYRADIRTAITPLLPPGVEYDRFAVELYYAVQDNPAIMDCEQSSIVRAAGRAVALDLEIGKRVFLVPLADKGVKKLNVWTHYTGDIELALRAGAARLIDSHCIYENEPFEHEEGTAPFIKHKPILDPKKRGKLIGAYAYAKLSRGELKIVVLDLEHIERVRSKSREWKPDKVKECPDWYAMKTCVHRLCRSLPSNPRMAKVLALLDHQEVLDHEETDAAALERAETVAFEPAAAPVEASPAAPMTPAAAEQPARVYNLRPRPDETAPERTLEWAKAFLFPFRKSELFNKPLGEVSPDALRSFGEWILRKQEEKADDRFHEPLLAAIGLVLADLEAQQGALPLDDAGDDEDDLPSVATAEAPAAAEPSTPASGSGGRVTMPKAGKVADALPVNPSFETMRLHALELLKDESIDQDTREHAEKRLADPGLARRELQQMITHLEQEQQMAAKGV